jgi:protein FAM32A
MSDEYALVSKGKLKLKTDSEIKKKNKKKEMEKIERGAKEELDSIKTTAEERISQTRHLTKAEISYKKMQEKMVSTIRLFLWFILIDTFCITTGRR